MSRRPRRREDWGGEDSDEEGAGGSNRSSAGTAGLSGLRAPRLSESSRTAAREGDDADSGSDSGLDSGAEGDEAAADVTTNTRERKKETQGRDHEIVATARMKAQGITMNEQEEEEADAEGKHADDEEEKSSARPAAAVAAAAADSMRDVEAPLDDAAARRLKMKALFDKSKDDKYMTFDAEDPLKPNPNKRRAAEREDENLEEEDSKDPWLLQAKEDAAKHASGDVLTHFTTHAKAKAPLVASTAIFDGEENAPIFNQSAARIVLLKHMQPGETVLRAVKRLGVPITVGGAKGAAAPAPAASKTKMKNVRSKPKEGADAPAAAAALDPVAEKQRKAAFAELTEAAQGFLSSGYVEIYGDTYEKIDKLAQTQRAHEAQIAQRNQARAGAGGAAASDAAPSAGADARARAAARLQRKRDARAAGLPEPESSDSDDDDDAPAPRSAAAASSLSAATPAAAAASSSSALSSPPSLHWYYKWSSSDSEVQGPFSAEKMAEWAGQRLIDQNVVVQRASTGDTTGPNAEQAKEAAKTKPWMAIGQVNLQTGEQLDAAPPAGNNHAAAAAADGHAKKKFKF